VAKRFQRLRDWWHDWVMVEFYVKFAWFHLLRRTGTDEFRTVFSFRRNPTAPQGWHIVSASWTPRGCRKSRRNELWWDRLMDYLGEDGRKEVVRQINANLAGGER
jgi:hypothetical protein